MSLALEVALQLWGNSIIWVDVVGAGQAISGVIMVAVFVVVCGQ